MDKHNDHLNQIAGLDGPLKEQKQTYRKGNDFNESPMLGGTQNIYSNVKRNSKAYKHSKAWQSSIAEAQRTNYFADTDNKLQTPNFTVQQPKNDSDDDKSDGEEKFDQPPSALRGRSPNVLLQKNRKTVTFRQESDQTSPLLSEK